MRGYDSQGMMVVTDLAVGNNLAPAIIKLLQQTTVDYIHTHNTAAGCFNCAVVRAGSVK